MSKLAETLSSHFDDVNRDLKRWDRTSNATQEFDEIRLFWRNVPIFFIPCLNSATIETSMKSIPSTACSR